MAEEIKIIGAHHFRTCNRDQKDFWRTRFLESNDPTGYVFAEAWIEDGYRKWREFVGAHGVKNEIQEWMDTLAVKLIASGILNIAVQRESFQASKWLADRGWMEKEDKRTKESKKKAEKAHEEIQEDMERLDLRLVKTK